MGIRTKFSLNTKREIKKKNWLKHYRNYRFFLYFVYYIEIL